MRDPARPGRRPTDGDPAPTTGASAKRIAFANDPLNLLAVDAGANRAKDDTNAAEWLPDVEATHCMYVARQIGVKAKYGMTIADAEHAAMEAVLDKVYCGIDWAENHHDVALVDAEGNLWPSGVSQTRWLDSRT